MPWKDTPEARLEQELLRRRAKLLRQLKKDPQLAKKLRVRAQAGDTLAEMKLRLLTMLRTPR